MIAGFCFVQMKYLPAVALWERFGTRLRMDRKTDLRWLKNLCFVQPLLFSLKIDIRHLNLFKFMASRREFRRKKKKKISRNSNAVWKLANLYTKFYCINSETQLMERDMQTSETVIVFNYVTTLSNYFWHPQRTDQIPECFSVK